MIKNFVSCALANATLFVSNNENIDLSAASTNCKAYT